MKITKVLGNGEVRFTNGAEFTLEVEWVWDDAGNRIPDELEISIMGLEMEIDPFTERDEIGPWIEEVLKVGDVIRAIAERGEDFDDPFKGGWEQGDERDDLNWYLYIDKPSLKEICDTDEIYEEIIKESD